MPPTSHLALAEENIRTRAYLLCEAEGCAHGRDDHYWREAIAQLQAESMQAPLSPSEEPDIAVVEKAQKMSKAGKSVAKKATKNTAKADDNAKAKAITKGSKKAATKLADQAPDAVVEPRAAAKKTKATKTVREISESGATAPVPAQPKKPRKTASDDSKGLAKPAK